MLGYYALLMDLRSGMWQVGDAGRYVLGLVVRESLHLLSFNAQQIDSNSNCTHTIDALLGTIPEVLNSNQLLHKMAKPGTFHLRKGALLHARAVPLDSVEALSHRQSAAYAVAVVPLIDCHCFVAGCQLSRTASHT